MTNQFKDLLKAIDGLTYTVNNRNKYIVSWDVIVTNTDKICSKCNSFNPDNCSDCSDYVNLVYAKAPTPDHGTDYLLELDKFNKKELADCFTWEDYEKD